MWTFLLLIPWIFSLRIDESKTLSKIAFGSCHHHKRPPNPKIFYSITNWSPDLYIWLGDSVYADIPYFYIATYPRNLSSWKQLYDNLKENPGYKELRNTTMVTGVWDDHDYGINDGDKNFILKKEAKTLYLEFLEEENSKRLGHEGIYDSYTFGKKGKSIKIILIDIRSFRDNKWDSEGDSLGEDQWKWLEKELNNPGDITILANGLQINAQERWIKTERWHRKSYQKLLYLLNKTPGVILLSGDVHMGEILKNTCENFPIYEITSSGMTHTAFTTFGPLVWIPAYGIMSFTYNTGPRILKFNFGTIEVDWNTGDIEMAIRDSEGKYLFLEKTSIGELYSKPKKSYLCEKSEAYRSSAHILAMLLVYLFPIAEICIAILIFLRKYSRSY
ncbi:unnamed protein product [Blepharisma stoltei]|uniref:PhoD-like phosphatase metallophosphatase domain-containing protein n=1 Tax=Blepharisma stoltei TaxID=1481888 RepID=A0AAU9J7R8_9CILI|nr:unnamed protein product [Blepharisma stoltei]